MGFLGGLAGTLNKVIGQNAEIQRNEEATIRSEDRAALRKFNSADNEQMIDGVLHHVLPGKDGAILAKRAFTATELADREAGNVEREAKTVTNKDILSKDALYKEWALKNPGKTKADMEAEVENARGIKDFTTKAGITHDYAMKGEAVRAANNMKEARFRASHSGSGGSDLTMDAGQAAMFKPTRDIAEEVYGQFEAKANDDSLSQEERGSAADAAQRILYYKDQAAYDIANGKPQAKVQIEFASNVKKLVKEGYRGVQRGAPLKRGKEVLSSKNTAWSGKPILIEFGKRKHQLTAAEKDRFSNRGVAAFNDTEVKAGRPGIGLAGNLGYLKGDN